MVRNVRLIEIGMETNMDNNVMSLLWKSLMGSTTKRGFFLRERQLFFTEDVNVDSGREEAL